MKCRPQYGAIATGDGEGTPAAIIFCSEGSLAGINATLSVVPGYLRAGWAGIASQIRASFIASTHECRSQQLGPSVAPDLRRTVRRDPSRPPFQSAQDSLSNNSYRFGGGVSPSLCCRSAGRIDCTPVRPVLKFTNAGGGNHRQSLSSEIQPLHAVKPKHGAIQDHGEIFRGSGNE